MFGRFLLVGIYASIGTAAFAAPIPKESEAPAQSERLRATCTGTLLTADMPPPGSRIMADGTLDLVGRRVDGFGLSSQPIVVLTAAEIDFGSSPPADARFGMIVEGSIDRRTGATSIVVRGMKDPSDVRIKMTLDCRFEQPLS